MTYSYKGPFTRIKHVGQTLSNTVRLCWTVLDQCWIVFGCAGCWSVQTNPTPSNNVGVLYQAGNYGIYLITRTKALYVGHPPTPFNTIQHV